MSQKDRIQKLEEITRKRLKEISVDDFRDSLDNIYRHSQRLPNSYALNNDGYVIGLSLQGIDGEDLAEASIDKFHHLSFLYLFDIKSSEVISYDHFRRLEAIALTGTDLTTASYVSAITTLSTLYLRNNQIADISFLQDLKGLTSLDLRNNQIADISFLQDLKGLTSLDLSFNQIADISFLQDLKGLTSLDLGNNQISNIPKWLTEKGLPISTEEFAHSCINLYKKPDPNTTIRNRQRRQLSHPKLL
ncbi:leucine-rich repeat domain-containing protein (plasmid) [Acaryochloris sp. 'Moss Beach']|uniref:leucine-rich repeat domain-containing protein n=1 Tax=Acaryochloris sp. 'Moss Beach' TaxID=2740837 RepID=UPI001F2BBAE3|nr:leucine-rich repeat domain-containing protein [Acaryochloris sp. 'Moss Beach']UJB73184.1 leucine-rich repeat domain-containing protein [Acaryochloris sp. 'Moss Beach']